MSILEMEDIKSYVLSIKDSDFINSFYKTKENNPGMRTEDICVLVANSPAPRFYVSSSFALRQYANFKRTGRISIKRKRQESMYKEIFKRFKDVESNCCSFDDRIEAMRKIVEEPAPSFYLEDSSAFKYYYRAMNRKRKLARR